MKKPKEQRRNTRRLAAKEAENQKVRVGKSEVIEGPLSIVGEIIHYAERN